MKLTSKLVESIERPGRYSDDKTPGLHLFVQRREPSPGKVWITRTYVQRLTIAGKRRDIGIGSPKWLTLTEARAIAIANYRTARKGGDPRRKRATVPTFADALDSVLVIQRGAWRNGGAKSEAQWRASLRDYAGALMPMTVDAIGPGDVLAVLSPVWNVKRETATRVRQRIGAVMKWAIAEGHRESNPVDAIGSALPKNGITKRHHKALAHGAVGGALRTVRESGAWWATRAAFTFLALTAARSGEVRGMRWGEIAGDVWTVPGERMKAGKAHRVPLSAAALAVLAEARERTGGDDGLVFPAPRGGTLSDMTISTMLKRLSIAAVPHGFRSSFRDWASETGVAREVAEMALAHVIENKAEAAYARSDLLDRRAAVMQAWAEYVHL